jgi:hypothetical protein
MKRTGEAFTRTGLRMGRWLSLGMLAWSGQLLGDPTFEVRVTKVIGDATDPHELTLCSPESWISVEGTSTNSCFTFRVDQWVCGQEVWVHTILATRRRPPWARSLAWRPTDAV